ncbi:MAG: hypothetical protein CMM25_08440, partial [Rhodospirillaceae bacterium]|nr:hypothetical protein [Rhodospirillaceae bacterium]
MAEAQNPCEINPAEGDENLALAQGAGLITNIIPSVGFESVTLEPVSAPNQEEVDQGINQSLDPQVPTVDILLNMSFVEGIKGEEAARWYDDARYTQYLRLRVVGCFNQSLSHAYDFTTQRFNEYGAGLMDTAGPEGATQFLNDFKRAAFGTILPDGAPSNLPLGTQVDNMMLTSGPFNTQEMTRTFKNSNNPLHFYPSFISRNDAYEISDTVVFDSGIENLMMTDEDGNVIRQTTNQILPTSIPGQNNTDETMYLMEKAFLFPIKIRIGPGVVLPPGVENAPEQDYQINDQLSFYAYMYFDYDLFMEELGLNPNDIEMDHTGLSSGMGFINPGIYLGTQARFPLQPAENPPASSDGMTQVPAKNGGTLQDVRSTVLIKSPPIDKSLFRTTKMILDQAGFDKATVKVIKDRDHISPLWLTKDNTDSARYSFAFDKRNFLSENSVLPSLYKNRAAAEELILGGNILLPEETVKVLSISMYKHRIDFEGNVGLEGGLTIGKIIPSSDNLRTPKKIILSPGLSVIPNISFEDNTLGIDMYE